MRTFAEVLDGRVLHIFSIQDADPVPVYAPPLEAVEVTVATGTPVEGSGWDGTVFTETALPVVPSYTGWKQPLYMSQGDKVIQNTVVETSSGAAKSRGSALLPSSFIDPTRLIEFRQFGVVSTGASGVTLTVRLKLAGGTVISLPLALPANMNNAYWELGGKIMGRTKGLAGTLVACLTLNGPSNAAITPTPVAVNTEQENQLDLTYQWSAAAAGNKLTVLGTFLEATT